LAEVAEAEIIAVCAIEDILHRVERVNGQAAAIVIRYADLLKTWEATHWLAGVVLRWVEAGNLQCGFAWPTAFLEQINDELKLVYHADTVSACATTAL